MFFFSIFLNAQSENFFVENKQVYWQKIYDNHFHADAKFDQKSIKNFATALALSGKISVEEIGENFLSGIIKDFIMDYKGVGISFMATPGYLNEQNKYSASYKVDFKDNQYRVTITNIKLKGLEVNYGAFRDDGNDNLEQYTLSNDGQSLKKRFLGRESKIIDHSFSELFRIAAQSKKDGDW